MNVQVIAFLLILATAPAITAFVVLYGFGSPWWRSLIGRALFVSSCGFALLIDLTLLYRWFGDDYPGHDIVLLLVLSLVCAGAWLKLTALLSEKRRARRGGQRDRFSSGL